MSTFVAQGLVYFFARPSLWRMTLCPILSTIVVGTVTIVVLLVVAMHPQEQELYSVGVPQGLALLCLAYYQDKIFEFVMREQGHDELMNHQRRHASCLRLCSSCCRGMQMYALLNGQLVAWEYHFFYFELKNYSLEQQQTLINERSLQYRRFGMQALLFEMISGIGAIFMFTNTIGAALFASSIEKEEIAKTLLSLARIVDNR
ncbi:unnamed protein product [Peronospora belbahrii]|uniref:Uncharacterized protein n=1 Tax=Peronospora belbahrii TaxID=622444 RepID=A0ABN8DBK5_9STRA|nr:unnamed protein product [Peronospora belbahrii]